ncbi:hypothetical protein Tco_1036725 [Tanacetum coccineum]
MCTMKVILASIIALAITVTLGVKSKAKESPFPASQAGDGLGLLKWRMQSKGDGLGLLKWRMQSKDASAVPLTGNFLYVSVSMLDDSLILLEVAKMG